MHSSRDLGFALAVLLATLAVPSLPAATETEPPLPPVGLPDLARFDPVVAEQIQTSFSELQSHLEEGSEPSAIALADSYRPLCRLYHLHDLAGLADTCFRHLHSLLPDDFAATYHLGVLAQGAGDLARARTLLESGLGQRPDDPPSLIRLGRIALLDGDLDRAQEHFAAVLALDPDHAAAALGMGRVSYRKGDPEGAVVLFRQVLELQPRAGIAHHALGMAYRDLGDIEQARAHLALAGIEPVAFSDPLIDGLGELGRGAQFYYSQGNQHRLAGNLDTALKAFTKAVDISPDHAPYVRSLGLFLAENSREEEAVPHLQRALELDPDDRVARFNLGTAYTRIGQLELAIGEFETLLSSNPADEETRRRLASILTALGGNLQRQGAHAAAIERLEHSLEIAESVQAHFAAAGSQAFLQNYGSAAAHYARAAEMDPSLIKAHLGLAMAQVAAGRFPAARGALERALLAIRKAPRSRSRWHSSSQPRRTRPFETDPKRWRSSPKFAMRHASRSRKHWR